MPRKSQPCRDVLAVAHIDEASRVTNVMKCRSVTNALARGHADVKFEIVTLIYPSHA